MNITKISSVEDSMPELVPGDFVVISGTPAIISRAGLGNALRAIYLSDGSFHEDFTLGKFGSKKLTKGSTVSVTVK